MAELTSMRNIGKEMEKKLKSVGICSAEELLQAGSEEAFVRLKMRYPNVCLVHLYMGWRNMVFKSGVCCKWKVLCKNRTAKIQKAKNI